MQTKSYFVLMNAFRAEFRNTIYSPLSSTNTHHSFHTLGVPSRVRGGHTLTKMLVACILYAGNTDYYNNMAIHQSIPIISSLNVN